LVKVENESRRAIKALGIKLDEKPRGPTLSDLL